MSRGNPVRVVGAWLAVTGLVLVAGAWLGPDAWALSGGAARASFADLLVRACAAAVLGCAGWFWTVTTVTAVEVLRGVPPEGVAARSWSRRVVLALCGVAVAAQLAGPAVAADGTARPAGEAVLAGLSLPERAVAGRDRAPARAPADERVVVRPGDSLWSLAARSLGPGATDADKTAAWHALYDANREVVGDDPDLIHPGQRLQLPFDQEDRR